MKITFLGTAAAPSYPLAFCQCDFCRQARQNGGKDFRKRPSLLINHDLLIDFGPDVVSASFMYHKSIADVRFILQTHSHYDHFDAFYLSTRTPEYQGINIPPLEIYGSLATITQMSDIMRRDGYINDLLDPQDQKRLNAKVITVAHSQDFQVGNYQVTAFSANHDPSVDPLLYAVTENDFTVLYATDTDTLPDKTWQSFKNKNLKFNVVVLDHTFGPNVNGEGHLNANRFIEQIKKMRAENLLAHHARIFATHISHQGNPTHEELSKYARQFGYEIAYDGLEI